jgi:pilus assembly protein FimV
VHVEFACTLFQLAPFVSCRKGPVGLADTTGKKEMRRKFSAFVALVACLIPLTAGALGLGQLKVNSALSQPLNAQIELLSASESELAGMTVRLAPADAFARVGLDRPFYLSQLKFDVVPGPAGLASIRVSSEASISEPFISFLVEVVWSRGRLLREYTILLDPPTTDGKGAPSVEAATAQSAAQPAAVSDSVPAPAPRTATTAPRTTFSAPMQPSAGSYGPVKRGDTLWKIANGLRQDDGVSVEQMMIALLQNNSQAFYDNNINRLKAGYVLRVPSRDEITSLSQSDALAEVRSQYAAYNLYRQQRAGTSSAPQVAGGVSGGGETSAPQSVCWLRKLPKRNDWKIRSCRVGSATWKTKW